MSNKLPREFYTRSNVLAVARELLGKPLVVPAADGTRVSGVIVETEAYRGPQDRASTRVWRTSHQTHGDDVRSRWNGPTCILFMHVSPVQRSNQYRGHPSCSLDSRIGTFRRSGVDAPAPSWTTDLNLTNGPGQALYRAGIDRKLDRADLLANRVWIEEGKNIPARQIASGPRIGIDYAEEWVDKPWRYWIRGNPFVSRRT